MKSLGLLRVVAAAHVAAVFLQPVLAGVYLNGSGTAIRMHEPTGFVVAMLGLAQILAAVVWWRSGGRFAAVPAATLILLAVGFQLGMGYSRQLAVHIPLGIAIVASSIAFTLFVFRATATTRARRTEVAA
ncbi:hypothetical protein FB561_0384 [Kribbella amoyensis]|uniref:Uncharacterized protein n=1 Tax=Kribbella amoyensis TaxID=996641 RepID=A0A561BKC4_9ACTN|nr:hypothetical protein [Kribbella amoyensis]TWD79327.1 hypothetical protein FB561_0384 [Kribbella amoyensis]